MAAECHSRFEFRFQSKLRVEFDGGAITGDAGLVLLREFDERLGLTAGLNKLLVDERDRRYTRHPAIDLVRQRIYQIGAGYEDGNDAKFLRDDPTMRAVVRKRDERLASQPTLSRWENSAPWDSIHLFERQGVEWYCRHGVERGSRHPEEILLDVDSSEDPTHGQQPLSFFNGFYGGYMYHPLFIFEAETGLLLASCLRPGNVGGIRQLLPLLRPVVRRLRARFPRSRIALRADGDFAKPPLLDYAEYAGCLYAFGMPRNRKLEERVERLREKAEGIWKRTGKPVQLFTSFFYKANTWPHPRRIVAKAEYTTEGKNLRFVVTNRTERADEVFAWYNRRGQAENFIKELKRDLCADRLSCSSYHANAFRMQLHGLAYNLLVLFRRMVLRGTELATATVERMRRQLLKIGARVQRSVRHLWLHLATGWPGQPFFLHVVDRLAEIRGPT
jgi:DDE family transposase